MKIALKSLLLPLVPAMAVVASAQDWLGYDGAASEGPVIVQGNPALTQPFFQRSVRMHELLMNLQMTQTEKARLLQIYTKHWQAGDQAFIQGASQIASKLETVEGLDKRRWSLIRRATILELLLNWEGHAANGEEYSTAALAIYRRAHPPLNPGAPSFSTEIADSFIDAYLFAGELRGGKAPTSMSAAARAKMRAGLAGDFVGMNKARRKELMERMVQVIGFKAHWPTMPQHERLLVRAELGAPLSLEERQMAQQVRQMMTSHTLKIAVNGLNAIQSNQQLIMGSAPYWNPSSQRWEQKGGIVTEFH
jgi:hypothetical protein